MIALFNNQWLLIDREDRGVRLVITDGTTELACRKERIIVIKRYIACGEGQLFKGRLQLYKSGEEIMVLLKGKTIGSIHPDEFEEALNK